MGKVLGVAKIREKGQITIPQEVRDYLELRPGDRISLVFENGKILVKRVEAVHSDFKIKE